MGRKPSTQIRVLGPYRDRRGGYEYEIAYPGGERERCRCGGCVTEEEARAEVDAARARIDAGPAVLSVQDALDLYAEHLRKRGNAPKSVTWSAVATLELSRASGEVLLSKLKPQHIEKFLSAIKSRSLATQRTYFAELARAAEWWKLRGLVPRDVVADAVDRRKRLDEQMPWETKAGRRTLGRGKAQLRGETEVVRFVEAALEDLRATRRVACVLPVLTGLSAGELLHLRVGYVDAAGGRIYVDDLGLTEWNVKTASRRRWVPIPESISEDVAGLCRNRKPDEWLLRGERKRQDRDGESLTDAWLRQAVAQVCTAAGIPKVSTHGLRATFASLVTEKTGATVAEVGKLLGHSDSGRTAARHYVGGAEGGATLRLVRPGRREA